jgi:uncharacterized protein with GYD domain
LTAGYGSGSIAVRKEIAMPQYLMQVGYSAEGWAALVNNPQDRTEIVRQPIENMGGKIQNFWFSFGGYDVVGVVEFPDNVSAAAIAMAFAAGGACKTVQTTPLLTSAEAVEAMRRASNAGYKSALATAA